VLRTTDRVPLLVMLHGCRQNAEVFSQGTRMNTLADRERFIVLYPEQSGRANPLHCWNWFDRETLAGGGEVELLGALVQRIISRYPVNPARVYVAGISAGGAMACALSYCHGRLFAASAVMSGVMFGAADSVMQAASAMRRGARVKPADAARAAAEKFPDRGAVVPMLVIHGDGDTTVHPHNAEQIIEQFCAYVEYISNPPLPVTSSDEVRITDGRSYRRTDYLQGRQVVARRILVEGLEHAWSGGDPRYPFNDAGGPDASSLVWDFVSMFRRG
jgi:poly(hydroxyalkanoate) depolymerase family esterase